MRNPMPLSSRPPPCVMTLKIDHANRSISILTPRIHRQASSGPPPPSPCVARPPRGGPPNRRSFGAHASAALGCRWVGGAIGGDRLVSIGGLDLCVLQWRRVPAMAV